MFHVVVCHGRYVSCSRMPWKISKFVVEYEGGLYHRRYNLPPIDDNMDWITRHLSQMKA